MMEKKTDQYSIRTDFRITEEMRTRAERLLNIRSETGNVATGDRGRSFKKQKKDSFVGCLGEIVALEAFRDSPISVQLGDGRKYDIRLRYSHTTEMFNTEVKTRQHNPDMTHSQRDMFLRKHPSNHSCDFFVLVKVYPGHKGVFDLAELIGYCVPNHAEKVVVSRDDIADKTNKYMVEEDEMHNNWDALASCIRKMAQN